MHKLSLTCPKCRDSFELLRSLRETCVVHCPRCGEQTLRVHEVSGLIYILSNDTMPGIVKIGFTERSVAERVSELSAHTGVALPYTEEASFPVSDPSAIERVIHTNLDRFRVSPNREFFRLSSEDAIAIVQRTLGVSPVSTRAASPESNASTATLYRPIGPKERASIESSGWRRYVASVSETAFFVVHIAEVRAITLARDWHAKFEGRGFVTSFRIDSSYASQFPNPESLGEIWVPIKQLEEFNSRIVGTIGIIHKFPANG